MIEIKDRNFYKVLKPELFVEGQKLLGKYQLWKNRVMTPNHICFLKSFKTYDGWGFDSGNDVWFGFNPEKNTLELRCSSMGGMCGFVFSEEDLKDKHPDIDRECMGFTINLVKELIEQGVIGDKLW